MVKPQLFSQRRFDLRSGWEVYSSMKAVSVLLLVLCTFHYLFIVEGKLEYFVFLYSIYLVPLLLLTYSARSFSSFSYPDIRLVVVIFVLGVIGKTFSRYDYFLHFLTSFDVYQVRSDAGQGGWYSYLAVLMYPSAILLIFLSNRYKINPIFIFITYGFLLFDMIGFAMRMTPMFVIFFHIVMRFPVYNIYKLRLRNFAAIILSFLLIATVFEYTTELKSVYGNELLIRQHLQYTLSVQVVKINNSLIEYDLPGAVYYIIFFFHYLFHSIGEFAYFVSNDMAILGDLSFYKLRAEFCIFTDCDFLYQIALDDERYGVYRTAYYSILFDFGLVGLIVFLITLGSLYLFVVRFMRASCSMMVLGTIITLSPIENFFYSGMGLVQLMIISFLEIVSLILASKAKKIKQEASVVHI